MKEDDIRADISRSIPYTGIVAVQGDSNSNKFNIDVYDDSLPYDFTGLTPKIIFAKKDNTEVYQDTTTGVTVVDATTGKLSVILRSQTISYPGMVSAEIQFIGVGDIKETSAIFQFYVRASLDNGALSSSNDITPLVNALSKVEGWDQQFQTKYTGLEVEYAAELTSVNVQLADKANQADVTSGLLLKRDKSIKLNATNDFDDATKAQMTGVTPITYSPIPTDNSVGIKVIKETYNINYFNSADQVAPNIIDNSYASGTSIVANTGKFISSAIPVITGNQYVLKGFDFAGRIEICGVYNGSTLVGSLNKVGTDTDPQTITIPANCNFIRLNINKSNNLSSAMVVDGNVVPTTYYGYGANIKWLRLAVNSIINEMLTDGIITNQKLAPLSVTTDKIAQNIDAIIFANNTVDMYKLKAQQKINIFNPAEQVAPNIIADTIVVPGGTLQTQAGRFVSAKMYIKPGTTWTTKNIAPMWGYVGAFYKADDTYITWIDRVGTVDGEPQTFVAPANTAYVRLNIANGFGFLKGMLVPLSAAPSEDYGYGSLYPWIRADNTTIDDKSLNAIKIKDHDITNLQIGLNTVLPTNLDVSAQTNRWYGKKANFIGDSITQGYTLGDQSQAFLYKVTTMLGLAVGRNYGISGSWLSYKSGVTGNDPMVNRFLNMDNDADIIAVAGGTNDWSNNQPLGDMTSADNTTIYGALKLIADGLLTKYPTGTIVFMSPIQRNSAYNAVNSIGISLRDVANAVKAVADAYSIAFLDMYSMSGLHPYNAINNTTYFVDGLHPNYAGHLLMANKITGFIKTL